MVMWCAMHTFVSALLATIAAIVTEMMLPDPDLKRPGGMALLKGYDRQLLSLTEKIWQSEPLNV